MGWTMFYLFVVLKIPLLALCWLCWWAIRQSPDDYSKPDDGRTRRPPHPRAPYGQPPRRGPHGDPAPRSPPRVRRKTSTARPRVS